MGDKAPSDIQTPHVFLLLLRNIEHDKRKRRAGQCILCKHRIDSITQAHRECLHHSQGYSPAIAPVFFACVCRMVNRWRWWPGFWLFCRVTVTSAKQVQSASNCHQTVTKKKPRYLLSSRVSIWGLVGPEWLEHSTYGLRVRCSTN